MDIHVVFIYIYFSHILANQIIPILTHLQTNDLHKCVLRADCVEKNLYNHKFFL